LPATLRISTWDPLPTSAAACITFQLLSEAPKEYIFN